MGVSIISSFPYPYPYNLQGCSRCVRRGLVCFYPDYVQQNIERLPAASSTQLSAAAQAVLEQARAGNNKSVNIDPAITPALRSLQMYSKVLPDLVLPERAPDVGALRVDWNGIKLLPLTGQQVAEADKPHFHLLLEAARTTDNNEHYKADSCQVLRLALHDAAAENPKLKSCSVQISNLTHYIHPLRSSRSEFVRVNSRDVRVHTNVRENIAAVKANGLRVGGKIVALGQSAQQVLDLPHIAVPHVRPIGLIYLSHPARQRQYNINTFNGEFRSVFRQPESLDVIEKGHRQKLLSQAVKIEDC